MRGPHPNHHRPSPSPSRSPNTNPHPRYVGMIIGLSTQLVPNLFVQIAVIMAIKVDFSGLTENWSLRDRLDPESVVYASLTATVVMVARLTLTLTLPLTLALALILPLPLPLPLTLTLLLPLPLTR